MKIRWHLLQDLATVFPGAAPAPRSLPAFSFRSCVCCATLDTAKAFNFVTRLPELIALPFPRRNLKSGELFIRDASGSGAREKDFRVACARTEFLYGLSISPDY